MKLALGTAQFGLDYGISNEGGRTSEEEARTIVNCARNAGVEVIDTSPAYGTSEAVLGRIVPDGYARLVTKTPHFGTAVIDDDCARLLVTSFEASLERLGRKAIDGLLIHGADDLLKPGGGRLFSAMAKLRENGLVRKIGVSIYSGRQIDDVMATFEIDLIQVPLNALDQRLIRGGHLDRLKSKGVEIHARSAFLQGLLLMAPDRWPAEFEPHFTQLRQFHDIAAELGLSPLRAALGFAMNLREVDQVVCGVNSLQQFQDLVEAAQTRFDSRAFDEVRCDDVDLIDPTRWKKH